MLESMRHKSPENSLLLSLIQSIVRDDAGEVSRLLRTSSSLARQCLSVGATRQAATDFYFEKIGHYLIAGDTPLHAAAAGYRIEIARSLIQRGANLAARNRRGAEPLHYAADGGPARHGWNPKEQAE